MPHPTQGYYRLRSGERVPSVTEICSRFKDSQNLIRWANREGLAGREIYQKRDEAAAVGTRIHSMIESHWRGGNPPPAPPELTPEQVKQAEAGFNSFRTWQQQTRLVVVEQEMPMVSETWRYGGCPDAIALINDQLYLLDWKSSRSIWWDFTIQVGAYQHLYEENHPGRTIAGVHIVRFGKSGGEFDHRYIATDTPRLVTTRKQFKLFREAWDNERC